MRILFVVCIGLVACRPIVAADSVSGDWFSKVQKDLRRSECEFSCFEDGAWSAPNRAHGLRRSARGLFGRQTTALTAVVPPRFPMIVPKQVVQTPEAADDVLPRRAVVPAVLNDLEILVSVRAGANRLESDEHCTRNVRSITITLSSAYRKKSVSSTCENCTGFQKTLTQDSPKFQAFRLPIRFATQRLSKMGLTSKRTCDALPRKVDLRGFPLFGKTVYAASDPDRPSVWRHPKRRNGISRAEPAWKPRGRK